MTTQFRKFRAREDPITIVKFPFSSRQWPPPPPATTPLFVAFFFFQLIVPSRSIPVSLHGSGIITELSRIVCTYIHTHTHTAPSMEVFRASIMASTHLRSISAYGVRPQERSLPPWTSSNVASDSPSPPSTETIRRLSSIWRRKERVGPARTSRAAMGADKLLLGNLVNREWVYSLFRSLLRE